MNKQPFYRNKVLMFLVVAFIIDALLVSSEVLHSIYLTLLIGSAINFQETLYVLVELVILLVLYTLIEKASAYGNEIYQRKLSQKNNKSRKDLYY